MSEDKLAAVEAWAKKYLEPDDQQVQFYSSAWEFEMTGDEYNGEIAANELRQILGWPKHPYSWERP